MEYMELVGRIVEAEHRAREISGESQKKGAELEAVLEQETAKLRSRSLDKARQRLECLREAEAASEQKAMAKLDQKFSDAMDAVETARKKYQDNWVDTLFQMIVGGPV